MFSGFVEIQYQRFPLSSDFSLRSFMNKAPDMTNLYGPT